MTVRSLNPIRTNKNTTPEAVDESYLPLHGPKGA